MKKVLPIYQPSIRAYLRHAFPMSIIEDKAFEFGWIFSKYIQIEYHKEGKGYLNYIYYDFFKKDGIFIRYYYQIYCLKDKDKIINLIKELIDNNTYFFSEWNEKLIPNKAAFAKYDFPHACLIYGYDDEKQELYTEGYMTENWQWKIHTVQYDVFLNALQVNSMDDSNYWCDAFKIYNDSKLNFCFSEMFDEMKKFSRGQSNIKGSILYGIAGCKEYVLDLVQIVHNREPLHHPSIYLLGEHCELMRRRICFLKDSYGLFASNSDLFVGFEVLDKQYNVINMLALKYNKTRNVRDGEKVIKRLLDSLKTEEELVNMVLEELEDKKDEITDCS